MHKENLFIFGSGWWCLDSITSKKFEFYEYKTDVKGILHVSSGNIDPCITPNSVIFRNIV